MASNKSWNKIFKDLKLNEHNFDFEPFQISAKQIKESCQKFKTTAEKEVRILCKQDTREERPDIFIKNNLFILPVKNGYYNIIRGEGYVDIPEIMEVEEIYKSKLNFELTTSKIGDSEMQHLDFAYASSLIRTFINDESLVLTIRGRKYTPEFEFNVNGFNISTQSVQTEIDAGYEGKDKIVLVEAKNSKTDNTIIRQLYYPYKQWKSYSKKDVFLLFFEKRGDIYHIWQYSFSNENDYNSIKLINKKKYKIL